MLFHSLHCSRISIRTSLLSFPVCTFLLLVGGCTSVPSLQFAHHSWHLHSPVSSVECKQQTAAYVEYQVRANRCKCKVLVFVSKGSEISMKHHFYIFFIQFTYLSALALILFTHPHHRVVWMSLLCSKCCNYFLQKEGQWKKKCTIPQGYNICSEKHIQ